MAQFWCTCGRGILPFVMKELQERISVSEMKNVIDGNVHMDGRVLFTLDKKEDWRKLMELKTIERLFYVIKFQESKLSRVIQDIEEVVKAIDWKKAFQSFDDLLESNDTDEISAKKRKRDTNSYRLSVRLRPKTLIQFRYRILNVCREKIAEDTDKVYSPNSYEIEISVQAAGGNVFVGIPLSREPLSQRDYMKHIGLRSTVSYIMADQIKKDAAIVMDPMCGCATILCEAARLHPALHCVGVDKNWTAAMKAAENAGMNPHVDIVCADAERLPFREGAFDFICCDLPFGKKHCPGQELTQKYDQWLKDWKPLLRHQSFALLTAEELVKPLETFLVAMGEEAPVDTQSLNLGYTPAVLLVRHEP